MPCTRLAAPFQVLCQVVGYLGWNQDHLTFVFSSHLVPTHGDGDGGGGPDTFYSTTGVRNKDTVLKYSWEEEQRQSSSSIRQKNSPFLDGTTGRPREKARAG